jgi:large subunit ribosomal protein L15e
MYKYYEVILVDPSHNAIRNDPRVNWICSATMKHRYSPHLLCESVRACG